MTEFSYRAINRNGRQVRGTLAAVSEIDLYQQLRSVGLDLVQCAEVRSGPTLSFLKRGPTHRDLIQLCVHLGQLIRAGVPLLDSLREARDSTDSPVLRDALADVHRDVNEGYSVSEAFDRHPKIFGPVFKSLIAAGEETGNLNESFDQLVKHLKWIDEMSTRVRKATRYPIFLGIIVVGVLVFMMAFVVPQVVTLLQSMGQDLPVQTIALIETSEVVSAYWHIFLVTVAVVAGFFQFARRYWEEFAYATDYYLLRLPLIGDVIKKVSLARFAHMLGVMYRSGIEILQALEASRRIVANRALAEALYTVRESVQQGNSLSMAVRASGEFPSLVVRMIKVGEDSGRLHETLENVTEMYDQDVDEEINRLIGMIEPTLTLVMGFVIVWIAVGVFGPIYDALGNF